MKFYFESMWSEGEGIVILGIVCTDMTKDTWKTKLGICLFNYSFGIEI